MASNEEDLDLLMRRTSDVQSTLKSVTAMAQKMMVAARRDKEKRSPSELQEDLKKVTSWRPSAVRREALFLKVVYRQTTQPSIAYHSSERAQVLTF